jgi:hypothetical protein
VSAAVPEAGDVPDEDFVRAEGMSVRACPDLSPAFFTTTKLEEMIL